MRGREGEWTGEKNKGERERTPLLGRSMLVTFLPFSLQCAAAVVVGACEGREGQRGVMRARGVLPGRTVTGASHSPSVGTYLEDSSQTLGCSPISTAHSIQTHAFRLALRSQSNTHSSSSSSSSHRVRTVTISTTTSESHQGVHLVAFSSIRPVRVYARLCVRAYLSTVRARIEFPPLELSLFWHVGSCASSFVHLLHLRRPRAQ